MSPQRATRCDTAAAQLMDDGVNRMRDWWKGTGLGAALRPVFKKASDFIREMGPTGEVIANGLDRVSLAKERRLGVYKDRRNQIFRGLSKADRETAAKVADGLIDPSDVSPGIRAAAEEFRRTVLDDIMRTAQFLDGYRVIDGQKVPIRGTGRAFPTLLNRQGRDFLDGLRGDEATNPRIIQWAERAVDDGRFDSIDDALKALRQKREGDLRGHNPYLEDVRVDLDPELREWDPNHPAFDRWLDRQATHLEGAREWGWDLERLFGMTTRLGAEIGDPAAVEVAEKYLRFQFGLPGQADKAVSRLHGQFRAYLNFRIFGGTVVGPFRNAGQPYTNNIDVPLSAHFRTLAEYPPIIGRFMREGDELRRQVLRAGGAPAEHPLTTFGAEAPGSNFTEWARRATIIHQRVIQNNEYRSGIIGNFGLQANIERLMKLQGETSPIMKAVNAVRHLAVNPEAATERAIRRAGLSDDRLAEIIAEGGRLSESDMLAAMQRASLDTQFGYTLATKPVTFGTKPGMQTIFFLKNWAVRQTEFIYDRVLLELANGNAKPLVKFLGATFLLGEAYNTARDLLTGSERSFTMNELHNPGNDDQVAVAYRIMRNIADGGGLGLVQDVMWGIGNFVLGPAGGTAQNLGRAAQHIIQAPAGLEAKARHSGAAIWDAIQKEFVVTRQAEGVARRIQEQVRGQRPRYFDYHSVRGRTFEHMDREEFGRTGVPGIAQNIALDAIRGRGARAPGPRTLTYEGATRAITAENVDRATEILSLALEGARDPEDYNSILTGIRQSLQRRAPLGALSQEQQREYLRGLSPDQRRETLRIQQEWERDADRAIREAARRVRPPGR